MSKAAAVDDERRPLHPITMSKAAAVDDERRPLHPIS